MGKFRNLETGVVVTVDDAKDERYSQGWEPATEPAKKTPAKKAATKPEK